MNIKSIITKLLTVTLIIAIGVLPSLSCVTITTGPQSKTASKAGGGTITDADGVAVLNVDGRQIIVTAVNQDSPAETLSNVKVSAAELQGMGLIYAEDLDGYYFPQLAFANSGLTQGKTVTVPMRPAGDTAVLTSGIMLTTLDVNKLTEVASMKFSDLESFVAEKCLQVRCIFLLFDKEVVDIERSTVSIYRSPFPEVVFAYFHKGQNKATGFDFDIMPKVYAADGIVLAAKKGGGHGGPSEIGSALATLKSGVMFTLKIPGVASTLAVHAVRTTWPCVAPLLSPDKAQVIEGYGTQILGYMQTARSAGITLLKIGALAPPLLAVEAVQIYGASVIAAAPYVGAAIAIGVATYGACWLLGQSKWLTEAVELQENEVSLGATMTPDEWQTQQAGINSKLGIPDPSADIPMPTMNYDPKTGKFVSSLPPLPIGLTKIPVRTEQAGGSGNTPTTGAFVPPSYADLSAASIGRAGGAIGASSGGTTGSGGASSRGGSGYGANWQPATGGYGIGQDPIFGGNYNYVITPHTGGRVGACPGPGCPDYY